MRGCEWKETNFINIPQNVTSSRKSLRLYIKKRVFQWAINIFPTRSRIQLSTCSSSVVAENWLSRTFFKAWDVTSMQWKWRISKNNAWKPNGGDRNIWRTAIWKTVEWANGTRHDSSSLKGRKRSHTRSNVQKSSSPKRFWHLRNQF